LQETLMEKLVMAGAAVVFLGVGSGMVFYELTRIKAGRPILKGHDAVQMYWMGYLAMFALAITTAAAAIIR
jgi:hypothetical protein